MREHKFHGIICKGATRNSGLITHLTWKFVELQMYLDVMEVPHTVHQTVRYFRKAPRTDPDEVVVGYRFELRPK